MFSVKKSNLREIAYVFPVLVKAIVDGFYRVHAFSQAKG